MRLKALTAALIGLSVLCLAGCGSTRQATSSHSERLKTERVETVEKTDSVIVEQRDTLREVTTITIDRNDRGDTLRLVQITDLTRARSRDNVVAQRVKTEIVRDTVYIEKRDSVFVQNSGLTNPTNTTKGSGFRATLKWIFWILVAIGALIIIIRLRR